MGVDLTLLPFYNEQMNNDGYIIHFSQTMLDLHRRSELWEPIEAIEQEFGTVVPDGFMSYLSRENNDEIHYGKTARTAYGDPLQYVRVKHLRPLADHECVRDSWKNRAAWAWLEQAPGNLKVALYWQ